MSGDHPSGPDHGSTKPPSAFAFAYSRRVFTILFVLVAAGLAVRWALIPAGFGEDGHYRAQHPSEEAAREPVHKGAKACSECHADQYEAHERDAHVNVACESCHGAGGEHVASREAGLPVEQGRMFRKLEQANCLTCHRQLYARPKLFPTVNVEAHFAKVGVAQPDTTCQSCHDPHQPLFLDRPVAEARIHPLIHQCSDCHQDPTIESRAQPEGHVVTFQCKDCHADVVADFESKPHAKLGCATCHMFHKDSEFSGRIHKNGNPRFCLMCHQDKPFKSQDGIPLIASFEQHLDDVADEEERGKRCADCHLEDVIHGHRTAARGVVVPGADDGSSSGDGGAR